jgi:HAD superfamily hydrolase (TIGR01509 family)
MFDMDGTLTKTTEDTCIDLMLKAVGNLYGRDIYIIAKQAYEKNKALLRGKPDVDIIKGLLDLIKDKVNVKINERTIKAIDKDYRKLVIKNKEKIYNKKALMPYINEFLSIVDNDYCIVTSALMFQAKEVAKLLSKKPVFIIAYEDTKKHKPNKEPYLKAKKTARIKGYKNAVVFEDSKNGQKAALDAGINVYKVNVNTWRNLVKILKKQILKKQNVKM